MENEFTQWLEGEMRARGWTQAELSRRSKIPTASIARVVGGTRKAGTEICLAIATAMNIPPDFVFRKAGLLPAGHQEDEISEEILHIDGMLSGKRRNELLEYARLQLRLQQGENDPNHPKTRPHSPPSK